MLNFRASLFFEGNVALANANLYYNSFKSGTAYASVYDEWDAPELQWDALVKGDNGNYYTTDGRAIYIDWNVGTAYFDGYPVRDYVYGDADSGYIPEDAYALDAFANDDGYVPLTDQAYQWIQPMFDGWGDGYSMLWVCSYSYEAQPDGYTMDDVGAIKNDDYSVTFVLTKYVDPDIFADSISGCLYCVNKGIYEANKKEVGGLIKSSYGTSNVNGEDVTLCANDWYLELFEGTYASADKDTRDQILAAIEYNLLAYYGNIPLLSQGSATLYQMRLKHGSDTWVNNVIGYGAFCEYTYAMDDAEWEAYCASNNYQLQY